MKVEVDYISAACNQAPHVLALRNETLIYGACNAVIEVSIDSENKCMKTKRSAVGHSDRVNCVRWLDDDYFVTGATDKTVCFWKNLEVLATLKGHEESVTCVDGLIGHGLIVSGSADSSLKIWRKNSEESWSCCQSIPCPKQGFVLDISVIESNSMSPWVIASYDDCSIKIYALLSDHFECIHTLKGHEDWSQTLDVIREPETGDILVASGSQDSFVRIWRIASITPEKALAEHRKVQDLGPNEDIKAKEVVFHDGPSYYSVAVETILSGHEDKVFGIHWCNSKGKLSLLSASLDKTIILWEQTEDSDGLWIESVRVGEVGGNTLGFLGCQISQNGLVFVGHSFNGALHLWLKSEFWETAVTVGGHFGPVEDLDWDIKGRYLVSTSKDQTTRVHAPWKGQRWHEVARPQVHGYDLGCLTLMPGHRLASGAEEKLVRVFEATKNFIENVKAITGNEDYEDAEFLAQGASVPSLGLSNKAVLDGDDVLVPESEKHVKDQFPDFYFKPEFYDRPPSEETLVQNTLWPEIHKLYGHGYELFCLASNKSGTILASACKAAQQEHANIILWSTQSWTKLASLENGHSLTVVQMAFSPNGKYLLTVSRDRTLALWSTEDFTLLFHTDKKTSIHQRIIWSCDWSADSKYFVTVGRDKKCVIWSVEDKKSVCKEPLVLKAAITAVAVGPVTDCNDLTLVTGLEDGSMYLIKYNFETGWSSPEKLLQGHHKTVKRLKFRPLSNSGSHLQLASCGSDHFVQLISLKT